MGNCVGARKGALQRGRLRAAGLVVAGHMLAGTALAVLLLGCSSGQAQPSGAPDAVPPPEPAALTTLGGPLVSTRTPALRWSEVSDPSGVTYTLEIHRTQDFASLVLVKDKLTGADYTLHQGEALPDGSYSWRVRAVDKAGNKGAWTSSTLVIDSLPPAAPQLNWPRRGESISDSKPRFTWGTVMDPSGLTYTLEVHRNQDFTSPLLVKERLTAPEFAPADGEPLPAATYFWRVRAVDGAGNVGPWATRAFAISTAPLAPYVAHTVEGRGDCLACHRSLWPVPATHVGRTNDTCQSCHQPVPGGAPKIAHLVAGKEQCNTCHAAGKLAPLPEDHAGRTLQMCSMCHEPSTVTPPQMAHGTAGREACTQCHGAGKLVPLTSSHSGRADNICLACHETSSTKTPLVTHSTEGRAACAECHAPQGIAPLPKSHEGRAANLCAACHDPSPTGAPLILHSTVGKEVCSECHATGKGTALLADHEGRTQAVCQVCHQVSPTPAPKMPHALSGRENCTACHGTRGQLAVPANHRRTQNAMCLLCHQ